MKEKRRDKGYVKARRDFAASVAYNVPSKAQHELCEWMNEGDLVTGSPEQRATMGKVAERYNQLFKELSEIMESELGEDEENISDFFYAEYDWRIAYTPKLLHQINEYVEGKAVVISNHCWHLEKFTNSMHQELTHLKDFQEKILDFALDREEGLKAMHVMKISEPGIFYKYKADPDYVPYFSGKEWEDWAKNNGYRID